ncbi:MAG: hypothetical protein QOI47_2631, partial [Actinomycetota bacterium]|nr:hypothetical protein [Actinomycetota bacterium]
MSVKAFTTIAAMSEPITEPITQPVTPSEVWGVLHLFCHVSPLA